ncbi:MAG TPA: hypothetical protein VEA80_02490 [Vitreimonas sp.]|uniref:hypothetical protein n=1 Tax=Vitreimonas sp. TaxID=3069702 RepID=UPI002D2C6E94|nr:hypothetical protein [Vitreimonas sp.]HYD86319.1 hypothetical protein [Vitreimonas sp.]
MFVRDHLAVVSHWARDQLRDGADTPEHAEALRQLIEAAEALRSELTPAPQSGANIISLDQFRQRAS